MDRLRKAKTDGKSWLADLEAKEREKTGIKNLKIKYNKVFGYYLEVTNSFKDMVPDYFTRKQTLANAERFITPELKELEDVILGAEDKLIVLEYELFREVRQKVADEVARFGGSWTFILSFVAFMAIWMGLNVVQPFGIAFDKYPFILLNLALSTLAAVQAPLIMMSQNRASDYDRLQARNDYHVNTQSKEEIRLLHEKIDHLVQQDQSDLLTIQKLQTEMIMGVSQQVEKMSDVIRVLKEERLERESHGNEKN